MKPRLVTALACLALVGAAVAVKVRTDLRAVRADAPVSSVGAEVGPQSRKASTSANTLAVEKNKETVFQRAFWRRPGAGDNVLHGERRDWIDASAAVQKWQWFVAVAPSPEFRRWLIEENPFELAPVATAGREETAPDAPPAWFPTEQELAGFAQYRSRGGRFTVFHDSNSNRIFATDTGAGFAAASR